MVSYVCSCIGFFNFYFYFSLKCNINCLYGVVWYCMHYNHREICRVVCMLVCLCVYMCLGISFAMMDAQRTCLTEAWYNIQRTCESASLCTVIARLYHTITVRSVGLALTLKCTLLVWCLYLDEDPLLFWRWKMGKCALL